MKSVETGRWLQHRQCGVRLEDTRDQGLDRSLLKYFATFSAAGYPLHHQILLAPVAGYLDDEAACDRLGKVLEALPRGYGT